MSIKKGVFYSFLTQFPTAILGVISGILITRILGPEGKGVLTIFQSDVILLSLLLSFNINLGLVYFISTKKVSISEMLGIAICLGGISFVIGALFLSGSQLSEQLTKIIYPKGFSSFWYIAFILLSIIFSLMNGIFSSIFQGIKNFRVINQVTLINAGLNVLCFGMYYLVAERSLHTTENVNAILVLTFTLAFVNGMVWLGYYLKLVGTRPQFNFSNQTVKLLIRFIFIGYLSNLINICNYRLDIWMVQYFKGTTELGFYSLSANIGQLFFMVSAPIAIVLQPYLNSPDEKKKLQKFILFSRINCTIVLVGGILAGLLAQFIIPLVYGKPFVNSVVPFLFLLPGVIFSCLTQVFAVIAISHNKIKYNLLATILGLIVTVVVDLILIPRYGIIGAAITSTFTYFTIFISVLFFCTTKLRLPLLNYFILTKEDIRNLLNNERRSEIL